MKNILLVIFTAISFLGGAQTVTEPKDNPSEWSREYAPFRIAGNLYYVGTYDLASYLVVTPKGNILVNTGLANSLAIIKKNIQLLGFKYKDTKILTLTQAHYDHMGAMAAIKKETGARLYVDEKDAAELKSGGKTDYEMGKYGITFKPVQPDFVLKNKDKIKLGNTVLTLLHHPGHTRGSCSFILETREGNKNYKILIANLPSIITDSKFSEVLTYKSIQKDYAGTFESMKKLDFDLWVSSHASQFDLHRKRKKGDPYNPKIFMDKENFFKKLTDLEKDYLEKVKEDSSGK